MHTSPITRDRIAESAAPMPRQDSQDFDDAERGFIARRVERTITNAEHRGAVGDELLPARRQWIGWAERNAVEEDYPTFIVRSLGWADTEPMPPRAQLKAYASYLMGEGIVWGGGITTEGGLTWVNTAMTSTDTGCAESSRPSATSTRRRCAPRQRQLGSGHARRQETGIAWTCIAGSPTSSASSTIGESETPH